MVLDSASASLVYSASLRSAWLKLGIASRLAVRSESLEARDSRDYVESETIA